MVSQVKLLPIGQIGVVRLEVPVYTIGRGKPTLGITCSVHGDECGGMFVVARLVDYLKSIEKINGTIHIILTANPAAQFVNKRVNPLDFKDLNRAGRGSISGTLTDRLAASLIEFLSECDFVVNLHEFQMCSQIIAAFIDAGTSHTKIQSLEAIRVFSPDIIWFIDPSHDDDSQYHVTLDATLAELGVPNFPIETTQLSLLRESEIDRIALGLLRVAAHLGICKSPYEVPAHLPPAYQRQEITADRAGLWEPQCKMMQLVDAGERLGTIRTIPDLQCTSVNSPRRAVLIQYRHRDLVATGVGILSLGIDRSELVHRYLEK